MSSAVILDADDSQRALREAASEVAFHSLMDALACAFQAVQQPECARLLGPLVPGATMTFGARVPGTSYQLDPVQAAFNIGASLGWSNTSDDAFGANGCHLTDNLGAILAVADYRARKLIAEGAAPPTVHDLFDALVRAHEQTASEIALHSVPSDANADSSSRARVALAQRCRAVRVASATAAAALLGGSRENVLSAAALARDDAATHSSVQDALPPNRWRVADATSRGVRLALIAIRSEPLVALDADAARDVSLAMPGGPGLDWQAVAGDAGIGQRVRERFSTSVMSHFPAVQAGKILAMFERRATIDLLPVNELVSMTVRN